MYCVYVLEDSVSKIKYIGYTNNIKRRLEEHKNQKGGHTTKQHKDWKLIYCELYLNQEDALGREKFLKSGSGWRFLSKQLKYYLQKRSKNG